MTTTIFTTILIISAVITFCAVSVLMMLILNDNDSGIAVGTVVTILFLVLFTNLSPSTEQLIENDYYAMMEDRPKCIDVGDVSLGCKKDYIDWQKDSIEIQHKYDSVKVKLDNKQKGILK